MTPLETTEIPISVTHNIPTRTGAEAHLWNFLAFISFFFPLMKKPHAPIVPTLRPLTPHPWTPMCRHEVKLQRSQRGARRERKGRKETQRPKILLSSKNRPKPQAFPPTPDPLSPSLLQAQLCVEEAVGTLAETSAQGNSNEKKTVRGTDRKREIQGAQWWVRKWDERLGRKEHLVGRRWRWRRRRRREGGEQGGAAEEMERLLRLQVKIMWRCEEICRQHFYYSLLSRPLCFHSVCLFPALACTTVGMPVDAHTCWLEYFINTNIACIDTKHTQMCLKVKQRRRNRTDVARNVKLVNMQTQKLFRQTPRSVGHNHSLTTKPTRVPRTVK